MLPKLGVSTEPGLSFPPPRSWRSSMRKAASVVGLVFGLYLIARAIAEPFVIDLSDPATYRNDCQTAPGCGPACPAHGG